MASIGTDTFFAPLSELNASLKAGEFSAEALARAFSERLQQLGPRYNALALPLHQEALRQATDELTGAQTHFAEQETAVRLAQDTAAKVAEQLMAKDALIAHARDELGISEMTTARPIQAALTSAS